MSTRTQKKLDNDEDETLSSDGSDSEEAHRDENGQDIAGRAEAPEPDATIPSPGPEGGRSSVKSSKDKDVVAWRDMPKKTQLVVITLARLSEPLTQTSLQVSSYV